MKCNDRVKFFFNSCNTVQWFKSWINGNGLFEKWPPCKKTWCECVLRNSKSNHFSSWKMKFKRAWPPSLPCQSFTNFLLKVLGILKGIEKIFFKKFNFCNKILMPHIFGTILIWLSILHLTLITMWYFPTDLPCEVLIINTI